MELVIISKHHCLEELCPFFGRIFVIGVNYSHDLSRRPVPAWASATRDTTFCIDAQHAATPRGRPRDKGPVQPHPLPQSGPRPARVLVYHAIRTSLQQALRQYLPPPRRCVCLRLLKHRRAWCRVLKRRAVRPTKAWARLTRAPVQSAAT